MFYPVEFIPKSIPSKLIFPKYRNKTCSGVRIEISDKKIASPLEIAVNILYSVYSLHPNEFEFLSNNFIDRLYGSDKLRNYILSDVDIELLFKEWKNNEEEFMKTKNKYLLYY